MLARGAALVFSDGLLPGLARLFLAALYAFAFASAFHSADNTFLALMSLALTLVSGFIIGWHDLAMMLFAPDWPLWHAVDDLGRVRRAGLAAIAHAVFAFVVVLSTASFVPHPGLLVALPLSASVAQTLVGRIRGRASVRQTGRFASVLFPNLVLLGSPGATAGMVDHGAEAAPPDMRSPSR